MKAHFTYFFLFLAILLLFNVSANSVPEYDYEKVKREDTPPDGNNDNPPAPDIPPATNPETTVPITSVVPTVPTTTKETTTTKLEEITTSTKTTSTTSTTSNGPTSTNNDNIIDNGNNNTNSTDTTNIPEDKKKNGLSGGVIALIVVGGIFAFGVVVLLLRALLKLCTRKRYEDPLPVLNVTASTEQLNPQNNIGQDSNQYYNNPSQYSSQTGNNVQNNGTVVGINESQQYYQQGYENGVDISNSQYQNQSAYSSDIASNSGNSNGVMEYQQQQQPAQERLLVPPVRQYSSLRRPTAKGGMGEIQPDDGNVVSGEITESGNVQPHKVVINKTNNTPIEPGTIHKTQFPFSPTMDDELRLNMGDAVEIIEVYDDGWSYGRNMATNELGVFPISYITGYNDPSNNF